MAHCSGGQRPAVLVKFQIGIGGARQFLKTSTIMHGPNDLPSAETSVAP
jgi:hypothetical protein